MNLTSSSNDESIITIADNSKADVHIVLKEGTENKLEAHGAGAIQKQGDETSDWLTISGEGSLEATSGIWSAPVSGCIFSHEDRSAGESRKRVSKYCDYQNCCSDKSFFYCRYLLGGFPGT